MDRGQHLIIPPLFNSTNYVYWKVCMRDFLQPLDEKVWQVRGDWLDQAKGSIGRLG